MIIFLYGPDSFQGQQKLREMKERFTKKTDINHTSLSTLNGSSLSISKLNEVLASNSLFASKRLVVVKNIFEHQDKTFFTKLLDYLQGLGQTDNIIIFYDDSIQTKTKKGQTEILRANEKKLLKDQQKLFDYLSQQQFIQYFGLLSSSQLADWIKKKLSVNHVVMNYQACQLLVGLLGNDLWVINNELDKLVSYKQSIVGSQASLEIELADVEEMVKGQLDQGIFALTDALSNKNKALAVKLMAEQIKLGAADMYLMTMLTRQFRILLQIRQGLDNGWTTSKIGSHLKVHPYILQKGINQARNFNLVSLKNIFSAMVKMDFNYKTGILNVETMVDLLIVKI